MFKNLNGSQDNYIFDTNIVCPVCMSANLLDISKTHKKYKLMCTYCHTYYKDYGEILEKLNKKEEKEQKVKADAGKPKLTLVPRRIIFDIAKIREYGNNKYPEGGVDNWKKVSADRYRDAAFRHFMAYLDDPYGVDEESGLPILWHLACNIAFLCELDDPHIKFFNEEA